MDININHEFVSTMVASIAIGAEEISMEELIDEVMKHIESAPPTGEDMKELIRCAAINGDNDTLKTIKEEINYWLRN